MTASVATSCSGRPPTAASNVAAASRTETKIQPGMAPVCPIRSPDNRRTRAAATVRAVEGDSDIGETICRTRLPPPSPPNTLRRRDPLVIGNRSHEDDHTPYETPTGLVLAARADDSIWML
jgi:hypothetical protein